MNEPLLKIISFILIQPEMKEKPFDTEIYCIQLKIFFFSIELNSAKN